VRPYFEACDQVGVKVSLYAGTKHTFATDAAARGVSERALQAFLGHADVRSTRRYARMADGALLEVLRPPRGAEGARGARAMKKAAQKQRFSGGGGGNRTRRKGRKKARQSRTSKPRSGRGRGAGNNKREDDDPPRDGAVSLVTSATAHTRTDPLVRSPKGGPKEARVGRYRRRLRARRSTPLTDEQLRDLERRLPEADADSTGGALRQGVRAHSDAGEEVRCRPELSFQRPV